MILQQNFDVLNSFSHNNEGGSGGEAPRENLAILPMILKQNFDVLYCVPRNNEGGKSLPRKSGYIPLDFAVKS